MEHSTRYILGHKTGLNTFKRIEIIQTMFPNHRGVTLEINDRKIPKKEKRKNPQILKMEYFLITHESKKKSQNSG